MGHWSDEQLRRSEERLHLVKAETRHVCGRCFADPALKDVVRANATADACDYCGTRGPKLAARLARVVEHIDACLGHEWGDASTSMPFDDETGEMVRIADVYDTRMLLESGIELELPDDPGVLLDDLVAALPDQEWCLWDPLAPTPLDDIQASWRFFCRIIKHERRFFFIQMASDQRSLERMREEEATLDPATILDGVFKYCARANLFSSLKAGTTFFRCQVKDDPYAAAFAPRRMGPAPERLAKQSNRMSPAGISMFYGAEDSAVALAETTTTPKHFAVAEFTTLRDIKVLDLRTPPAIPSIFDAAHRDDRRWASFMQDFIGEFQKPIARDGAEHVDYVPTQVVTEYLRTFVHPADGILYTSTKHAGGTAVVLFADTFDVEDAAPLSAIARMRAKLAEEKHGTPWLRMTEYTETSFAP